MPNEIPPHLNGVPNPTARGYPMTTYTGRQFFPCDPRPDDVSIKDIAHALSLITRFGGHCREFYSVAQHSVLVSYEQSIPPAYRLQALLHDAPEAYVGDMPRPLKHMPDLGAYREVEDRIWAVVAECYNVPSVLHPSVDAADHLWLSIEAASLMPEGAAAQWNLPAVPAGVSFACQPPQTAERLFLERYMALAHTGRP